MKKWITSIALTAVIIILAISSADSGSASDKSDGSVSAVINSSVSQDSKQLKEKSIKQVAEVFSDSENEDDSEKDEVSKKEAESEILKRVILYVKQNIADTEEYENFSYSSYQNSHNKITFTLNWSSESDGSPSMNVVIDEDEFVTRYNSYGSASNSSHKKILDAVSYTKDDAVRDAMIFVRRLAPEYIDEISEKYSYVNVSSSTSLSYAITFYRIRNDMKVENEYVTLSVNSDGKITSYSNSLTVNVSKNSSAEKADYQKIAESFQINDPLQLKYIPVYDSSTGKQIVRLVYLVPQSGSKVVDAKTGNMYSLEYKKVSEDDYEKYNSGEVAAQAAPSASDSSAEEAPQLSEAEQTAVDKHLDLLNGDDVKNILLQYGFFDFTDNFDLTWSQLYSCESVFSDKRIYKIKNQFSDGSVTVYVSTDAETGEILSYSSGKSSYKDARNYMSKDKGIEIIANVLKEMYGDRFSEYRIEASVSWGNKYESENVTYTRYVNDIPFEANNIGISINKVTGKIISVYFNHSDDAVFPSPEKAISLSDATDCLFSAFPLRAYYKIYLEKDEDKSIMYYTYNSYVVKRTALVYSYNDTRNLVVDAFSGEVSQRYNTVSLTYTEPKYFYPNAGEIIKNHKSAEKILALYNLGIIDIDKNFNPEASITNNEFDTIMRYAKGGGYYYDYDYYYDAMPAVSYSTNSSQSGEVSSWGSSPMTKSQAVVNIINSLGHSEIAKLSRIFKSDGEVFKGVDQSLVGYYAIADELGLLKDISPDTKDGYLTYAGACCFAYNYILYTQNK